MRRTTMHRILKWTGTASCALILLATVACLRWYAVGVGFGPPFGITLSGGAVNVYVEHAHQPGPPPWTSPEGVIFIHRDSFPARTAWWQLGVVPSFMDNSHLYVLHVPLWILFLLACMPTIRLWRSDRYRSGHCTQCGYNLFGNVSGCCPECGTPITPHASSSVA